MLVDLYGEEECEGALERVAGLKPEQVRAAMQQYHASDN
jgi:hypothetical protein